MSTIKEKILYIQDIIADEVSETINDFINLTKEYNIYPTNTDLFEIHMSQSSLSLLFKSIAVNNPKAIFLSSLINAFRKLAIHSDSCHIKYRTTTHALTVYYLRALAKIGIVEITNCEKCFKGITFSAYYKAIGNDCRRNQTTNLYDVTFIKLRNLTMEDLYLIRKIERAFKIGEEQIVYKEKNNSLKAHISRRLILSNALSKQIIDRTKERFTNTYDSSEETKRLKFKK